ncbi:MAG: BamA/TamA family outer membrane protein [Oligoflexia bacterium]|nr:BamA/TamA family outer membrane protein [Oligoflexia bacterium]
MKLFVLLFLFLFPVSSMAVKGGLSWFTTDDEAKQKWAVMPSYSRNATYGNILGGRFFIYPTGNTGYYTALEGTVSEDLFFSTSFSYKYWRKNGDQFHFNVNYNGFSEPYYGDGSQTKPGDRRDLPIHKIHIGTEYVSKIISHLYGGFFVQFDHRKEKGGGVIQFPWEMALSGGFLLRYDSRNSYFNSTQGEYYEVRSWMLSRATSPIFLEGDGRLFFSPIKNAVLAVRGVVGVTLLNPSSHLFQFYLGGPNVLRGFRLNRFRGEQYYLSQTELRYTLWKFLTIAGFFDLGLADQELSLVPRYSFGGGLRFGLPPDYNKKIRVEIGKGEDQFNFVISFGHPF